MQNKLDTMQGKLETSLHSRSSCTLHAIKLTTSVQANLITN
jgi:hypothetical protein